MSDMTILNDILNSMRQIITKNGVVICVTSVPYPAFIIRDMKRAEDDNDRKEKRK